MKPLRVYVSSPYSLKQKQALVHRLWDPIKPALLEASPHSTGTLLSSNHDSFVSLHKYLFRKDEELLKDRISNNGIQYRELR